MPTSQQMMQVLQPALETNNIMTTVNMLWGPGAMGSATVTTAAQAGFALNDSDNAAGWIFCVPVDGIVTDIGIYLTAENGTSPAFNCGLVTLDSAGRPTTSAYGGSAITSAQWTNTGWQWVTLSTPATVSAGDFAAVHIYPGGTPPDGSNNISVLASNSIAVWYGVGVSFSTLWGAATGTPAMAIKYDTGVICGLALSTNTIHVQVRSNTTPDEVGCLFQLPAAMTCNGARFYHANANVGSAATIDVVLYDASNTVLASTTISDKDFVDDISTVNVFWDSVNLSPSTNYRLTIKPGVGTNGDVYTPKWTFESTAALAAIPEGNRWQYTSQTDAGGWDDSETMAVCPMALWISGIEFTSAYGFSG